MQPIAQPIVPKGLRARSVAGRKDTYENLWMYYVELAVKGSYKPLGSICLELVPPKKRGCLSN